MLVTLLEVVAIVDARSAPHLLSHGLCGLVIFFDISAILPVRECILAHCLRIRFVVVSHSNVDNDI